ncbi:phage portal protein [Enterococcus casseliflavus]|uniref:phage portal protein n=1 Tax=Enterococcus casseliflavus TaxID=37734 RepID=UPI002DBA2B00|nr:phage portal protein [Enterococcus casseliflavus]MEB6213518.1 phage portal protein [Enterococcus casseliflavus]
MLEKYKVPTLESITPELIQVLIQKYTINEVPRIKRLKDYYEGNSNIKKRTMADTSKPNNKIANPFASYITDTTVGYWLGKPVAYQSEDEELLAKMQIVFDRNHEASHNSRLGKDITVAGVAYELLYLDNDKNVKLKCLNPETVFMIYDTTVEETPLMAVRFLSVEDYLSSDTSIIVEVYTDTYIQEGMIVGDAIAFGEPEAHYFGKIPVIQYRNNDEATGGFEKVIDLIDSYDSAVSDTSNNIEYFADAYLVLSGLEATEQEDIQDMKENRVMVLAEGGKAEWLVKGQSSVEVEGFKDRLREDIFTLSQVPNLSDESFGNATSGVSLQYKLFGLENIVSITERNFTASLEKRLELITNIFNILGGNHDYTYITMAYTRNIPSNMTTLADAISKLNGIVSHETLLSLLPFIDDPAYEIQRINNESQDTLYEGFQIVNKETGDTLLQSIPDNEEVA